MTLKKIHQSKNPNLLVITPLREGDNISENTIRTVMYHKKKLSFDWYSYEGSGNVMKNFLDGFSLYKEENNLKRPQYIIKIDNDTTWKLNTLTHMYETLSKCRDDSIAYCYCSFEYVGKVNAKFPAIPFNKDKLKKVNYISSNSMFRTEIIENIPPIIDDKYVRLLDYAYFLHLLYHGYRGIPCEKGYFRADTTNNSISSRDGEDYKEKFQRVYEDFIKRLE